MFKKKKRSGSCVRGEFSSKELGSLFQPAVVSALSRFRGNCLWTQRGRLPQPQVPERGRVCGRGEHLQLPLPAPVDRYVLWATSTGLVLAPWPLACLQSGADASATLKRKAVGIKTTTTRGNSPMSCTSRVDILCKWINVFWKHKTWLCSYSCGHLLTHLGVFLSWDNDHVDYSNAAEKQGKSERWGQKKRMYGNLMVLLLLFSCLTYFYLQFSD